MSEWRGLSLFSGIGGLDLAFEWAGGHVAAMCEIQPYCQKNLKKNWPLVPIVAVSCTKLRRVHKDHEARRLHNRRLPILWGVCRNPQYRYNGLP